MDERPVEMTKVGIIIPTINLWNKYTKPALDSIADAVSAAIPADIACDMLLIDNASTDETLIEAPRWFREHYSDETALESYHRNTEQWGFQRSVNFGVNYFFNEKKYDYVLVLNNDIVLHKDAIVRLVERFKEGGVAMATCLDVTGECQNDPANLHKLDADEKMENCPETPHPCFSAFMISKWCWEHAGEFDEIFFPAYYEDNDYHYRMQLGGLLAITYPPAMFFHYGSRTQLEALPHRLTDSSNQHTQYIRKWGGDPGRERNKTPYHDARLTIRSVRQNTK